MRLDDWLAMRMRVIAMRKEKDRMLDDLYNERRIIWRISKMDRTMIGEYLRMVLDYRYKK